MEQNQSKIVEEDSEKEMLFLTAIGLSIISTMKAALHLSHLLGQSIVKMLGMKVKSIPQSKSSLEMEEWLPLSIGTTSSDLRNSDLIPLIDCEDLPCMASDDGENFCYAKANKMFDMPLGLPNLPVCGDHIIKMNGLTAQETFAMMVDLMTDEDGLNFLKEITDYDDEF